MTRESILGQYDPNTVPNAEYLDGCEIKATELGGEIYIYAEGFGQLLGVGKLNPISEGNFKADFRLQNELGAEFTVLKGSVRSIIVAANSCVKKGYFWIVR